MKARWAGFATLGFLCCFLAGCGPSSEESTAKLKVGTVDVIRVMEERPETVDIRLEWASQAGSTYMEISEVQDEAEAQALKAEIDRRSQAWQRRMDGFMEESIQLVEKETALIARERGLDIVVVDNPLTETLKYREGEDLTLDVSLKLQGQ